MREKETNKKSGVGLRGPMINARCGDYSGDKIIANQQSKHNPQKNTNTMRVYSLPTTTEQEAAVGAGINL